MGRLAGFRYREVTLRSVCVCLDFALTGPGAGSHELWRHETTGRKVTIPHHSGDMAEGTLRAILREAGVSVESFLKAR